MKMNPSIALFAASALLAGVAGAQEKAAEAPAADQPKQEKEITVSPEQMKKDLGYFLGFQSGQQLGSIPALTFAALDQESPGHQGRHGPQARQGPGTAETCPGCVPEAN